MKKALIIGGGFAGCSTAHMLALEGGWDVTLVEAGPFLGGGCKTLYWGGHPYTFGPRHFLTRNEAAFAYLDKYCPLRRCADHVFLTYVERDAAFYSYPIHRDDIERMPDRDQIHRELAERPTHIAPTDFEDFWIKSVGRTLYDKYINTYSTKMWQVGNNTEIDTFNWSPKGVTIKDGPREAWDIAISAFPKAANGYDDYFALATASAKVLLNTRVDAYDLPNKSVTLAGERRSFDIIVNTIPPDTVMNYAYGELPFIGRDFLKIVLPVEEVLPSNIYFLYYPNQEIFTRIVEYKKFYRGHKSPTTLLGLEIPSNNGRLYPLPIKRHRDLADRYFADMPDGVFSIGRAGSYRYEVDIDDCLEQSMDIVAKLR
ncbi:MAG: FAD-dependent oxidoreductase [Magnetospirillum sp.]|nr:FAD-dependent oxidoreductase [Magnetospirillum sp.]